MTMPCLRRRFCAVLLALAVTLSLVSAQQESIVFKKVDFFEMQGEKEKKHDARLVVNPTEKVLTFADEKKGVEKAIYATVPYEKITKIVYERSAHRRYKSGLLVTPWLLFRKARNTG